MQENLKEMFVGAKQSRTYANQIVKYLRFFLNTILIV